VLTGSTNFSITGFYVNSNHVLVFDDAGVAALYGQVFEKAWSDHVKADPFRISSLATEPHPFAPPDLPDMDINFSPHDKPRSQTLMDAIAARIAKEGKKTKKVGSVLFAVMQLDQGESP